MLNISMNMPGANENQKITNSCHAQHNLFVRYRRHLFCLLFFLFINACDQSTLKPPFRLGCNRWPGYETLFLGRGLGYLHEDRVRLVELPSALEVMHALRNGTLEAGCLTLDEALSLLQEGLDLRVILVFDFSSGGDTLLAKPEFTHLSALKGKRIGVENTSVGAILLDGALHSAGMNNNDIKIISAAINEHLALYQAGKVDALVSFEPVKTQLLARGARQLFDSSEIPGRIINVLVVRRTMLNQYATAIQQLIDSQFKALAYLQQNPQAASERMAPRLQISANAVLNTFQGMHLLDYNENRQLLIGKPPKLQVTAASLAQLLQAHKLLSREVSVKKLVDARFITGKTR